MPGSSTIVEPVGSQTAVTVISRAATALRQLLFSAEDVKTPETLYRVLTAIQRNVLSAFTPIAQNPTVQGVLLSGVTFTGAVDITINHGLGRAYQGYYAVADSGVHWTGFSKANPPGVGTDKCITLHAGGAGTWSFWVY